MDPLQFVLLRCRQLQAGQSYTFLRCVAEAAVPFRHGVPACLATRILDRLEGAQLGAFMAREDPVTHEVTVTRLFSIH